MAAQQSLDTIQSLYVAYYGRPADPEGLNYWAERLEASNGNLSEIINAFGTSAEYSANLGSVDTAAQINSLYQQLFGRDAENTGLSFYTNMIDSGEKTLAEIALTISEAAQGSDRTTFEGRTNVANAFTRELDTPEEIAAYSSERGVGIGRAYLQRVTEQTSSEDVLNEAAPVVETLLPATPPSSGSGSDNNEQPLLPLVLKASEADGKILTGAGNVEVLAEGSKDGKLTLISPLDLSNITVNGDKTIKVTGPVTLTEATLGNFDIAVAEDSFVFLTAAQASSRTVTGANAVTELTHGGSIAVLLDGAAYDLSGITAGAGYEGTTGTPQNAGQLIAFIEDNVSLNDTTDLGKFTLRLNDLDSTSTGKILTLSAAQATGRIITGNIQDKVIITGLTADTDLSGITNVSISVGDLTISEAQALVANGKPSNLDYNITDTLENILSSAPGVDRLAGEAATLTASDVGAEGTMLTLKGIDGVNRLNFGDASVVDVTLTQAQLKTIEASYVNDIAQEDTITVTGVTGFEIVEASLPFSYASALTLLDSNDTIVVADEENIMLTAFDLKNLSQNGFIIEATTPGIGNDAILTVTNIHDQDNLTATGLIDIFDVSQLTDNSNVTINDLAIGDMVAGINNLSPVESQSVDSSASSNADLDWTFSEGMLTYEFFDSSMNPGTATINLTGVTAVDYDDTSMIGHFTVTGVVTGVFDGL